MDEKTRFGVPAQRPFDGSEVPSRSFFASRQKSNEERPPLWTTRLVFLVLVILTLLMILAVKKLMTHHPEFSNEIRATN